MIELKFSNPKEVYADNDYVSIVKKAISEIEFVYKNNGNGSFLSLIDYVENNYEE